MIRRFKRYPEMRGVNHLHLASLVIVKIFSTTCFYLGNDEPGVFLARLGLLFKGNPVSQSDQ